MKQIFQRSVDLFRSSISEDADSNTLIEIYAMYLFMSFLCICMMFVLILLSKTNAVKKYIENEGGGTFINIQQCSL